MGEIASGAHWGNVIAAYAATAVILGALIAASVTAGRRARRELETLEKAGPRRRRAK